MSEPESAVASVPPRVLLIDLENCPAEMGQLPETLSEFSRIIVCFAGVEPKVPLGLVIVLASAIHEGRLEFVGMDKGGKNAADFGLAFWAGRLVSEMPEGTTFTVLSADADLDHVVNMLRKAGRQANRQNGGRRHGQGIAVGGGVAPVVEDAVDHFVAMRLLSGMPRPSTRDALTNTIKAVFGAGKWKGTAPATPAKSSPPAAFRPKSAPQCPVPAA